MCRGILTEAAPALGAKLIVVHPVGLTVLNVKLLKFDIN